MVGLNYGSIFHRLWTKVHQITSHSTDLCVFVCESWGSRIWRRSFHILDTDTETVFRQCGLGHGWRVCTWLWTACGCVHKRASSTSDQTAPHRPRDPRSDEQLAPWLTWSEVHIRAAALNTRSVNVIHAHNYDILTPGQTHSMYVQ